MRFVASHLCMQPGDLYVRFRAAAADQEVLADLRGMAWFSYRSRVSFVIRLVGTPRAAQLSFLMDRRNGEESAWSWSLFRVFRPRKCTWLQRIARQQVHRGRKRSAKRSLYIAGENAPPPAQLDQRRESAPSLMSIQYTVAHTRGHRAAPSRPASSTNFCAVSSLPSHLTSVTST